MVGWTCQPFSKILKIVLALPDLTVYDSHMTRQENGAAAEWKACQILRNHRRLVQKARYNEPFDILVDGKIRVEVKASTPSRNRGRLTWTFNVHRHGILREECVDVYIFKLEEVPESKAAVYLLFKAPLKKKTVIVSFKSLLDRYGWGAWNFHNFIKTGTLPETSGLRWRSIEPRRRHEAGQ